MEVFRVPASLPWAANKYMYVSGQEQNLGVDWGPVLGRLDPTSNSCAGIHILLLGLELIGFSRKSRSLHPVSLVPLSGYTCWNLLGWCLAEGCKKASDWATGTDSGAGWSCAVSVLGCFQDPTGWATWSKPRADPALRRPLDQRPPKAPSSPNSLTVQ